jgi:transposase InsO family protein
MSGPGELGTLEEFFESRKMTTNTKEMNDMVTNMKVNEKQARVLLDTGTRGTNLISSSWAQTHNIPTKNLPTPITIHRAAKGSKTNANGEAYANVEIRTGHAVKTKFLIVAISSYDIILGMPFLQTNQVILNTANSTAHFEGLNYTIQCAVRQPRTLAVVASAATIPEQPRTLAVVASAATISEQPRTLAVVASAATIPEQIVEDLPPFDKIYPTVFPEKEPEGLPPLRPGCNHVVRLDAKKLDQFKFHARRVPDAYRQDLVSHLDNWKRQGIAVPGPGRFPCSIIGRRKVPPSKGWPWVNDLRDRNSITERDYTPLPNAEKIREDAARANVRSLLDLSNAYHQVRCDPTSEELNTINADDLRTFQVKVMLQGDSNAPGTMMRVMNTVLGDFIGKFVWVYLDDILIFSESREQHLGHLAQVFRKLEAAKFYLRMEKCQFMVPELKLLGHIIKGHEIHPQPERIRKIQDWREPRNKKQLQSFLGVVNYVAPHLFHSSTILAPLTELTSNTDWRWDDLQRRAFMQVKDICRSHVPLIPLDYTAIRRGDSEYKVFLITDASRVGTGAFICHGTSLEHAKTRIASIHSRRFTATQENYHTTDQEPLAIVNALHAFELKLLGIRFTVVTDHKALQYLVNKPIHTGRLARWLEYIQMFDFDIVHTPGATNNLADSLSRLYEDEERSSTPPAEFLEDGPGPGDKVSASNAVHHLENNFRRLRLEEAIKHQELAPETFLTTTTSIPLLEQEEDFYPYDKMPRNQPRRRTTSQLRPVGSSAASGESSRRSKGKKPRRQPKKCSPELHWTACRSRDGCPFHYTSGFKETFSGYKSLDDYHREWSTGDKGCELTGNYDSHDDPEYARDLSDYTSEEIEKKHLEGDYEWLTQYGFIKYIKPGTSLDGLGLTPDSEEQEADDTKPRAADIDPSLPAASASPIAAKDAAAPLPAVTEESPVAPQPGDSDLVPRSTCAVDVVSPQAVRYLTRSQTRRLQLLNNSPSNVQDEGVDNADAGTSIEPRVGTKIFRGEGNGEDTEMREDTEMPDLPGDEVTASAPLDLPSRPEIPDDSEVTASAPPDLPPRPEIPADSGPKLRVAYPDLPQMLRNEVDSDLGAAIRDAYRQDPITLNGPQAPYTWHSSGFVVLNDKTLARHPRVYIPDGNIFPGRKDASLRQIFIHSAHEGTMHQGLDKTYMALRQNVYWPNMYREIKEFCSACLPCQRNKDPTTKPHGVARMLDLPTRPWQSIAIDFLGPLNRAGDGRGYKYVMVVIDRFSSAIVLVPLRENFTAKDVADTFLRNIYPRYGLSDSIVSDQDPRLTSNFWTAFHRAVGIELIMATAFHQNTNGQVERAIKTISQMLRIYTQKTQGSWYSHLWRVEHAFNHTPLATIKLWPFEIQFGHLPKELPTTYGSGLAAIFRTNVPDVDAYLEQQVVDNAVARTRATGI